MTPRPEWSCVTCGEPGVGFNDDGECLCEDCLSEEQMEDSCVLPDDCQIAKGDFE